MIARLSGDRGRTTVIWRDRDADLVLDLESLRVVGKRGWLLCQLEVEGASGGRRRLQAVFFLGREGEAEGLRASSTVFGEGEVARGLIDRWGRTLQRLLWDGVLDVLEGALDHAEDELQASELRLLGFGCGEAGVDVDLAGSGWTEPKAGKAVRGG